MKNIYVITNNTKYVDGHHVTVNNQSCQVCGNGYCIDNRQRHDKSPHKHHLCYECIYWYNRWLERDTRPVVRVDGIHFRITYNPDMIATIHFIDGRKIHTENLWLEGTIPPIWIALGLTDNAEFVG